MIVFRQQMTDELVRRNYFEDTARCYLRSVAEYARYFHCPPIDRAPNTSANTAHLFEVRQLSSSAVNQQVAALPLLLYQDDP